VSSAGDWVPILLDETRSILIRVSGYRRQIAEAMHSQVEIIECDADTLGAQRFQGDTVPSSLPSADVPVISSSRASVVVERFRPA